MGVVWKLNKKEQNENQLLRKNKEQKHWRL